MIMNHDQKGQINKNKDLIIITDIQGNNDWIQPYVHSFSQQYNVILYDSLELASIDTTDISDEDIHKQFVNGGVELAVKNLIDKTQKAYVVLGFSIGGLIAWKATLQTLQTTHLIAISSTRLRFEHQKPSCGLHLFYGENDAYRPKEDWFKNLNLSFEMIPNQGHEVYKNTAWATYFIQYINNLR